MTVYALAQMTIDDRERYDRYAAAFLPTLEPFGGRVLAADESPAVVEGSWPYGKVVILSFPDRDSYKRWATSPEYQAIVGDRVEATTGVSLLVNGF